MVRHFKISREPDITLLGSGHIALQRGMNGLLDDYQFVIVPIALGGGTLFSHFQSLRLIEQHVFRCGRIAMTYGIEEGLSS